MRLLRTVARLASFAFGSTMAMIIVVGRADWKIRLSSIGGRLLAIAIVSSWVVGYIVAVQLEAACVTSNAPYGAATIVLPVAIGIATVSVALLWRLRQSDRDRGAR